MFSFRVFLLRDEAHAGRQRGERGGWHKWLLWQFCGWLVRCKRCDVHDKFAVGSFKIVLACVNEDLGLRLACTPLSALVSAASGRPRVEEWAYLLAREMCNGFYVVILSHGWCIPCRRGYSLTHACSDSPEGQQHTAPPPICQGAAPSRRWESVIAVGQAWASLHQDESGWLNPLWILWKGAIQG